MAALTALMAAEVNAFSKHQATISFISVKIIIMGLNLHGKLCVHVDLKECVHIWNQNCTFNQSHDIGIISGCFNIYVNVMRVCGYDKMHFQDKYIWCALWEYLVRSIYALIYDMKSNGSIHTYFFNIKLVLHV